MDMDISEVIREHYSTIGKKGGKALLRQRGTSYFSDIGKKRWAKQKGSVDKPKNTSK